MAQMGELYRFYLTYGLTTVESTPTNWDGMELQANRTGDVVDRSISLEFEFYGQGASLLIQADDAESHNAVVSLRIDKRQEDWAYLEFKTMKADMLTFTKESNFASVAFMEQTLREQVEDKADTVFEIDVDEDYKLSYTGVDRIRENRFTAVTGRGGSTLYGYWVPQAYRTTAQTSQAITWSDDSYLTTYDRLRFKAIAARTIRLNVDLFISFKKKIVLHAAPTWARIGLYRRRAGVVTSLFSFYDTNSGSFTMPDSGFAGYYVTGKDGLLDTDGWRRSNFHVWGFYLDITLVTGDEYFVGYEAEGTGVFTIETTFTESTSLDIVETATSPYVARAMPVLHHERLIEKLLEKMEIKNANGTLRTVGNGLTYNLPTETVNDGFLIAYCGVDSLLQREGGKMSLSLNQAMSLSNMRLASCLTYTDTAIVVDLIENQYNSSTEVEITPINGLKISLQDSLIKGSVEVGFKTDENDASNVANEVICKNTYTIPSGKGDAITLGTDIMCSPYCIESRIESLLADDTNSDTKDNTVFAFAVRPIAETVDYEGYYYNGIFYTTTGHVTPIVSVKDKTFQDIPSGSIYLCLASIPEYPNVMGYFYNLSFYSDLAHTTLIPAIADKTYTDILSGIMYMYDPALLMAYYIYLYPDVFELINHTFLDKRHVGIDASYFNIPLSPMRCIKAHAKSIGTSCVENPTLTFASTERKADCITKMSYEANYTDEKVVDSTIISLLSAPYYLPYTAEFTANWKIPSLSTLLNNVLYTAFEQKTGRSVKGYINILTLQLSKVESQQINLLAHEV